MSITTNQTPTGLSRLWRNRESRGVIIQILTMAIVFALLAAIGRNVVINLEAVGKDFSFEFLSWPAAYDIGFSPFIEYTNKSTHLMAGVVGLLEYPADRILGLHPRHDTGLSARHHATVQQLARQSHLLRFC